MFNKDQALIELHAKLGYKHLSRTWEKLEILLGFLAVGGGLFLGNGVLLQTNVAVEWGWVPCGLALFVLGGYLALAGQRSHLYQSGNKRTVYLAEMLHPHERKEAIDESR
jgi:hypothetical protein